MNSKTHWSRPLCGLAFLFLAAFGWTFHGVPAGTSPQTLPRLIVDLAPAVLPLLAVGLASALAAGGSPGLRGGLRFLFGGTDDARAVQAERALRAGGRAVVSAGLVISLLASFAAFLLLRGGFAGASDHPSISPADLAGVLHHTLFTPIVALALGRGLLGSAADAAALAAGDASRGHRRGRDDLVLLVFLLPGLIGLFAVVWPIPSL